MRPLLVELIGLAGVGKSTLVRAVVGRIAGARPGLRLHRARDLPAVAIAAGRVAPAFFADLLHGSGTAAHDARYSLRLLAHRRAVERAFASRSPLVLVDEGPAYMLARLMAFGSATAHDSPFRRQWERSLEWWRDRLDAIVWLDAPDDILATRIRARAKDHRAKHTSDAALSEFLARYRAAYAAVVERLTVPGGPRIIRLDGRAPVEAGVDHILSALPLSLARWAPVDS